MNTKIIISLEALSQSFVPKKLLHREKELSQLSNSLNKSINTFIYGKLGSGKTTLIKRAIGHFNTTKTGRAIYVDCSLYQTTNAIFHEILLSLNRVVSSKSNYDLTKRLKARIKRLDSKVTICLDHFDHLKEIETLNRILSLGLGLIIVSGSQDAYQDLSPKSKVSITNLIEIPRYRKMAPKRLEFGATCTMRIGMLCC